MSHRIFVTGASGYIGSAVATCLAHAGHEVTGLVRDPARGAKLAARGVRLAVGDLAEPAGFASLLRNCDVAIHAAAAAQDPAACDSRALDVLRDAVTDGRVRRVLYTSGVWAYGDTGGRVLDETGPANPFPIAKWRGAHEDAVLDLAHHDADVLVFQPATVYGGGRGILGSWFAVARDRGELPYPGDGTQRWSLVHRADVAEAYRLAIERPLPERGAKAGRAAAGGGIGERFILTDGSVQTVREIAVAAARVTGVPAREWPRGDVLQKFGPHGEALLASHQVSSAKARRELGWVPRHTSFVAEIEAIHREWQEAQGMTVR